MVPLPTFLRGALLLITPFALNCFPFYLLEGVRGQPDQGHGILEDLEMTMLESALSKHK